MPANTRRVIVKADLGSGYSLAEVQANVEAKWNLAQIFSYRLLKISPASNNAETQRFNFHYELPEDKAALAQELANTLPGTSGVPVVAAEPLTLISLEDIDGIEAVFAGTTIQNKPLLVSVFAATEYGQLGPELGELRYDETTATFTKGNINTQPSIYDHTILRVSCNIGSLLNNDPFSFGMTANKIAITPNGMSKLSLSHGALEFSATTLVGGLAQSSYGGASALNNFFYVNEFGKLTPQRLIAPTISTTGPGDSLDRQLIASISSKTYIEAAEIGEYWVGSMHDKWTTA